MSSLQKFHRRTMSLGTVTWPPTAIGGGDATRGFWLGGPEFNALVVAPKSTEAVLAWGSYGTARGTTNTTNGVANTNTLYAFGNSITTGHPAAYHCKTLTTGGYNSWYLPAKNELLTMYSNKSTTPFFTTDLFKEDTSYWMSTELNAYASQRLRFLTGYTFTAEDKFYPNGVRATRRYALPTATIGSGDSTNGYWLGTAGDGVSKLVVAPTSTQVTRAWGSYGTDRNTTSTTNGLANTNTLHSFGSVAHPAAYYCKSLTTGGYNTWYLPAQDELMTIYSNKSAVPFATANSFSGNYYWSSTENTGIRAWAQKLINGGQNDGTKATGTYVALAVRRV